MAIKNVVLLGFGGPAAFLPTLGFSIGESVATEAVTPGGSFERNDARRGFTRRDSATAFRRYDAYRAFRRRNPR